jgi:hypothetical protein
LITLRTAAVTVLPKATSSPDGSLVEMLHPVAGNATCRAWDGLAVGVMPWNRQGRPPHEVTLREVPEPGLARLVALDIPVGGSREVGARVLTG